MEKYGIERLGMKRVERVERYGMEKCGMNGGI